MNMQVSFFTANIDQNVTFENVHLKQKYLDNNFVFFNILPFGYCK